MEPIEEYVYCGVTFTNIDSVLDTVEYLNSSRSGVDLRTVYARKNLGLTNKKVHPYDKHEVLDNDNPVVFI